ncbi:MAG: PaaI family thioesterase [Neisseriaceae bacterium]|nr:PaaI family thioesterase [Neisseriaceae bacterium]
MSFIQNKQATEALHQHMPYAAFIGMQVGHDVAQPQLCFLPFKPDLIGNTVLPSLHGGLVAGFLQSSAWVGAFGAAEGPVKLLDFSLDYLRPGLAKDAYADFDIVRIGQRIVNVQVRMWQQDKAKLIATARAHFERV